MKCRTPWVVALLLFCQPVVGLEQEVGVESQLENIDRSKTRAGEELHELTHINSLLVAKDIPILGGNWSGELFVDIPLNGESDDTAITL